MRYMFWMETTVHPMRSVLRKETMVQPMRSMSRKETTVHPMRSVLRKETMVHPIRSMPRKGTVVHQRRPMLRKESMVHPMISTLGKFLHRTNLTLLVRLIFSRSWYSHIILVLVKSSKSKSQLTFAKLAKSGRHDSVTKDVSKEESQIQSPL